MVSLHVFDLVFAFVIFVVYIILSYKKVHNPIFPLINLVILFLELALDFFLIQITKSLHVAMNKVIK